ncbi:MAG: redoxin family protein [Bacteroidota bacterium]
MRLIFFLCLISTVGYCQTNVSTGQPVNLNDFKGAKKIVVIFTSNVCAYDAYYSDRIKSLINTYGANVQFVLVNSYLEPEETEDKMKAKYDLWAFGVPYVADKDQVWMKTLGARKSPEVFVLDSDLKTIYNGAIDDNPQLAAAVKDNYLKKVLDGVAVPATRVVGCSIRSKD